MQRGGMEMRKVFQGDSRLCKGPEAGSGCMLQELTEDQCGWSSLEKGLEKGIMVERPMANGDPVGTVTSRVDGVKLDFGGGIDTPCGLEKSGYERSMGHTDQKLETLARPLP